MERPSIFPQRIPILYSILAILIVVGVVPIYFYTKVVQINRDQLVTNERLLQNTITRSLADDITQRQINLRNSLSNLSSSIQVTSGGNLTGEHVATPELRALLNGFVTQWDTIAYASLLNTQAKGISAGRIAPDPFLQRELERAFQAARESRDYNGQPLTIGSGKDAKTVRLVSTPLVVNGQFSGMLAAVVDLTFLIDRLADANQGGLETYVVDIRGRLVASANPSLATGQDMTNIELVKSYVDEANKQQVAFTTEFNIRKKGKNSPRLGT